MIPSQAQLLRYLYERRAELTYDISHAKAEIIARETELARTERAIAEITERERLSDEN